MADDAKIETTKVDPFFGQILDADGHTYTHPSRFDSGQVGQDEFMLPFLRKYTASEDFANDRKRNREHVWEIKGIGALGAYDPDERLEALDLMGIRAQLLFPAGDNDENIEFQRRTHGRVRAAVRLDLSDPAAAMKELDRCIKLGAQHLNISCAEPPGGVSPAHEQWDPLWARCEEADVVCTLHLGCGGLITKPGPMMPERGWGDAAALRNKPAERSGGEEAISPYFMLIAHMGAEVFLQTVVMGGVFERFPKLRFGIIELGAKWVGPCVERMDQWAGFMARVGRTYPMKPSEYVRRNVRVTPFWHEDVPLIIDRYGMEEIYCFSTDYPHLEGHRDPIGKFRKHLDRLPEPYARDFMIENAKWLFPGL